MKNIAPSKFALLATAVGLLLITASSLSAQTLLLQLQAQNYDAVTGIWTATVGSNAQAALSNPTLVTGATANGSSAVAFTGSQPLVLTTPISGTPLSGDTGFTAFAFVLAGNTSSPLTIFGGGSGSFQYRIYPGKQDILSQGQADLGGSGTALSTSSFSSINVTVPTSGASGSFRLNSAADTGSVTPSSFGVHNIQYIGSNTNGGGGEPFSGEIAEIRIYSGIMTDLQRQAVEDQFTASYVTATAIPEPGTYALLLGGASLALVAYRRCRAQRS